MATSERRWRVGPGPRHHGLPRRCRRWEGTRRGAGDGLPPTGGVGVPLAAPFPVKAAPWEGVTLLAASLRGSDAQCPLRRLSSAAFGRGLPPRRGEAPRRVAGPLLRCLRGQLAAARASRDTRPPGRPVSPGDWHRVRPHKGRRMRPGGRMRCRRGKQPAVHTPPDPEGARAGKPATAAEDCRSARPSMTHGALVARKTKTAGSSGRCRRTKQRKRRPAAHRPVSSRLGARTCCPGPKGPHRADEKRMQ